MVEKSKEFLQDMKIARDIRDMTQTEGWKHYSRLLEHHIREQTTKALMPVLEQMEVDGIKQVLVGESAKGAILGLKLALSLPSGIIAQYSKQPSFAGEQDDE